MVIVKKETGMMGILIIVPSWNRHRRDLYHNRAIIEAQVCFLVKDAN